MRTKHIVLAVAIIIAAITQLQAQPAVETLTVDTLCYLGKGIAGEAGGAYFLPDGNIVLFWKSIPHIIDSKTGEVIRRMDTVHSSLLNEPRLTTNGLRLGGISMGPKLNIWDVPSGKIIFQTEKKIIDYCFSPDGTKMYVTLPNNTDNPGLIAIYDMATFKEIERLSYSGLVWAGDIDISPDGQTLAVSVDKTPDNEYDKLTNPVILINLNDKKNYTIVETLLSGVKSMEFSPDGKQIAFLHEGSSSDDIYIYIYNLETKEKERITNQQLSALFGNIGIAALGKPMFMDNNIIYTGVMNNSGYIRYSFTWNILENRIKNYINFPSATSIDVNDNLIIFCTTGGMIGQIEKKAVIVKDGTIPKENFLTYQNNQLELDSDKAFIGGSMVYDTTGKLIINLGSQPFIAGKNLIRINQPLLKGIYILTINDKTEQLSYKFIVE